MRERTLSRFAVQTLRRIAKGRKALIGDNGGARMGTLDVPASVMGLLESRDLIRRVDGRFVVTEAGRAYLRRSKPAPKPPVGEPVSGERAQHMQLARSRARPGARAGKNVVNEAESPLGWLRRRRGRGGQPLLSERQVEAGERLREDFERGGLAPRMIRAYDAPPMARSRRAAPEAPAPTERQIDARKRVEAACEAMGPGLADVALRVCCHLEGLEEAERGLGWPVRSGKLVLSFALDRLADHYEGKSGRPKVPETRGQGGDAGSAGML